MLLEKSIKFFLNLLDSNIANIVKNIFIIPTEDIQKIIPGRKKVLTLQNPDQIFKKNCHHWYFLNKGFKFQSSLLLF